MSLTFRSKFYIFTSLIILAISLLSVVEFLLFQKVQSGQFGVLDFCFTVVGSLGVVSLGILHAANHFTLPIKMINEAVSKMRNGDFDGVLEMKGQSKSAILTETINSLRQAVLKQVLSQNIEIEERLKVEKELKLYKSSLEQQVSDRTKNLHIANNELRSEIIKREKAEIDKEQMQRQAFQSSRFASLGEMAGGIAHEVNNPLAIIKGKSQQLKAKLRRGDIDKEKTISDLDKIDTTVDRIIKIIKGLKTLSRDGKGEKFESHILTEIIEEGLSISTEKLKNEGIELKKEYVDLELRADCRSTQISQVVVNLLNNAYDAISENCDVDDNLERWIKIQTKEHDKSISIEISNGGPIIPKEIVDQVLLPFFTTKEVGKGTGLGLSISRSIINDHKGELTIDTSNGHTMFIITLRKNLNSDENSKNVA